MLEKIKEQARDAVIELIDAARLEKDDILVIGCSSSEIGGHEIGSDSSVDIASAIFDGIYPILQEEGIYLAVQCCEHLNRAIIIERVAMKMYNLEQVNVVPQPKAGGSLATAAYRNFLSPVAVEEIKADAGMDIGGTLIGMHLKKVAVPLRLSIDKIGEASVIFARTRLKCIGGSRAAYYDELM